MQLFLSDSLAGLFVQVLPVSLLVTLIYLSARCITLKNRSAAIRWPAELLRAAFVCYLTGLINLVLVPANFWTYYWFYVFHGYSGGALDPLFSGSFDLIPTFVEYLAGESVGFGRWLVTMLVGNFLMLVPMGVFLPLIFPRLQRRQLWLAAAIPLAIELLQPVVGRSFDTDDLLLNSLGILAGWGIVALLRRLLQK